jgi:SARP family transcriptional regulator, regulator of embCAB operon
MRATTWHLRRALALWRGPAFADISLPSTRIDAAELEQRRLGVITLRLEADLALGRHEHVITELRELSSQYPRTERFTELLMRTLIMTGRHNEAETAYRTLKNTLPEDLPLHPSPELQALHRLAVTGALRSVSKVAFY